MEHITSGELAAISGGQSYFDPLFRSPFQRDAHKVTPESEHKSVAGGAAFGAAFGFSPNIVNWLRRRLGRGQAASQ